MTREQAIEIICKKELGRVSIEKREELLLDWWGFDNEDSEFEKLPKMLQEEILETDEPKSNASDCKYDPLLIEALKHEFIGVRNEYLKELLSKILLEEFDVVGEVENLLACPCCLYKTIKERGRYEICPVCFWEDDGSNDENYYSSVNRLTISEGRNNFKKYGCVKATPVKSINSDMLKRYLMNEV